ncbi:DUF167 domain-containing protein [Candidatus Liberibacter americanus]|uniref:DUF167 domain-containing protein n=1 Tax=Candidatus Liberibacter americanus TaxID=309868 RepID=UPI001930C78D|nr:DUF167 domain-containing protein [Candidatus Liberibacter americanus]
MQIISNAKRSGLVSLKILQNSSVYIKIKVNSPPEKGKANQEMIKMLSKILSVKKSSIKIISGERISSKKLHIDANKKDLMEILEQQI